jgi:hypothetical protein
MHSLTLAQFQHDFTVALGAPDAEPTPELAALTRQPGFMVYRHTVMKSCIDALQANYPTVARLVGEPWFRAAAGVFAGQNRPHDPCLLHYGAGFSEFLAGFEPAASLPYLPGVARLDRMRTECHVAPDTSVLDSDSLTELAPQALAGCVLRPHPAARWAWFEEGPVFSIWRANNESDGRIGHLEWQAEGGLLVRATDTVAWIPLDAAGTAFLDVCHAGGTLAQAAAASLERKPEADLALLLAGLLQAGAFAYLES